VPKATRAWLHDQNLVQLNKEGQVLEYKPNEIASMLDQRIKQLRESDQTEIKLGGEDGPSMNIDDLIHLKNQVTGDKIRTLSGRKSAGKDAWFSVTAKGESKSFPVSLGAVSAANGEPVEIGRIGENGSFQPLGAGEKLTASEGQLMNYSLKPYYLKDGKPVIVGVSEARERRQKGLPIQVATFAQLAPESAKDVALRQGTKVIREAEESLYIPITAAGVQVPENENNPLKRFSVINPLTPDDELYDTFINEYTKEMGQSGTQSQPQSQTQPRNQNQSQPNRQSTAPSAEAKRLQDMF
jgi:hypothetical protein